MTYQLAQPLGVEGVPYTVLKEHEELCKVSSMQFVEGFKESSKMEKIKATSTSVKTEWDYSEFKGRLKFDDVATMGGFDNVIGALDRHSGNWGLKGNKIVFIDNGWNISGVVELKANFPLARPFLLEHKEILESKEVGFNMKDILLSDNYKNVGKRALEQRDELTTLMKEAGFPDNEIEAFFTRAKIVSEGGQP